MILNHAILISRVSQKQLLKSFQVKGLTMVMAKWAESLEMPITGRARWILKVDLHSILQLLGKPQAHIGETVLEELHRNMKPKSCNLKSLQLNTRKKWTTFDSLMMNKTKTYIPWFKRLTNLRTKMLSLKTRYTEKIKKWKRWKVRILKKSKLWSSKTLRYWVNKSNK